MIAPLNIKVMIVAQRIHDQMRTRTTIVNIANHVQQVDRQALYQIADSDNKIVRPSG